MVLIFKQESDSTLGMSPKAHFDKELALIYFTIFGKTLNVWDHPPLILGNYPKLYTSELLNPKNIDQYQYLIASL